MTGDAGRDGVAEGRRGTHVEVPTSVEPSLRRARKKLELQLVLWASSYNPGQNCWDISMYFSISRHATILSKLNKVAPLPTSCAMLFWPYSSRVHSCVTVNSIAIAEGGNGRTQEFLLGGGGRDILVQKGLLFLGRCWRRKYCFASRGEQIIGGYPKTITFLNIPGI